MYYDTRAHQTAENNQIPRTHTVYLPVDFPFFFSLSLSATVTKHTCNNCSPREFQSSLTTASISICTAPRVAPAYAVLCVSNANSVTKYFSSPLTTRHRNFFSSHIPIHIIYVRITRHILIPHCFFFFFFFKIST